VPKRPEGVSLAAFNRDPGVYAEKLNRTQSIGLAKYLDYWYHEKNKPKSEDEAYDILLDLIQARWPKARYLKKVGHKVVTKGRKEVQLPIFMPSLDKAKADTKNLPKFLSGAFVVSDKLDGISLLLEYRNGIPYACYTRGDGTKGQDVSGVIPALNIPKRITDKSTVLVRCEFIIKRTTFNKRHSKAQGKGEYKTSRNMGGGLLTRNEPSKAVSDFDVKAYEISKGKGAGKPLSSQLAYLKRQGFTVVRHKKYSSLTVDQLTELLEQFRSTAKYDIDGIVVTKDKSYSITRSNPKHAKAFKMNSLAASKVVKIKDIEWRRSRYGKLVPRVILDPIELGGVTVTYLTGHNFYYIQHGFRYQDRNKGLPVRPLGKGAEIRVIRSGDVIPWIMEVVKPVRKPSQPQEPFTLDESGVFAMAVREKGAKDPALRKQRITHFFSAMKMKGVKAGQIERLYDAGFRTLRSILHATEDKLLNAGFKEKTAQNITTTVRKGLADATFAKTAYASSVFGDKIGESKMQAVIDAYPDIMERVDTFSAQELQEQIEEIEGIKTQARVIARRLPKFAKFLERNRIQLVGEVAQVQESNKLEGIKVLFTSVRDDDLLQSIKANGGDKASSVKSATHLVVKPGASNKKTAEAEDKGIPIMTVDEFRKKFKL
tara:strand:- start:57358 stop:59325 length:1968 start_codon:yes stop_codon:yes gene_type:complete